MGSEMCIRDRCAFESQHPLACTHVMQFLNSEITFFDLNFTYTNMTNVIFFLKNANYKDIHLSFSSCNFSVDEAVALLQGVGDHQLSLTFKYVIWFIVNCCILMCSLCLYSHCTTSTSRRSGAESLVDALSLAPVPGLVQLE